VRGRTAACAILSGLAAGCAGLDFAGDGTVRRVDVPWSASTGDVRIAPGDRGAAIAASHGTIGGPMLFFYDSSLTLRGRVEMAVSSLSFDDDGARLLAKSGGEGHCLTVPDLEPADPDSRPGQAGAIRPRIDLGVMSAGELTRAAGCGSWVAFGHDGDDGITEIVGTTSLERGRRTFTDWGTILGCAYDPGRRRLYVATKPDLLATFDIDSFSETGRMTIPGRAFSYDVAVSGPHVLVGTRDGAVLVLDPDAGKVVREWSTGGKRVEFAVSADGTTLVTAAVTFVPASSRSRVDLVAYRLGDGETVPLARTSGTVDHTVNDIAVFAGRRTVVVTGHDTLAWDY
jgi:WD40 repeat protein